MKKLLPKLALRAALIALALTVWRGLTGIRFDPLVWFCVKGFIAHFPLILSILVLWERRREKEWIRTHPEGKQYADVGRRHVAAAWGCLALWSAALLLAPRPVMIRQAAGPYRNVMKAVEITVRGDDGREIELTGDEILKLRELMKKTRAAGIPPLVFRLQTREYENGFSIYSRNGTDGPRGWFYMSDGFMGDTFVCNYRTRNAAVMDYLRELMDKNRP